jgi:hypothetical protein
MKVFFDGKVPSYFTVYKLTLVPGENVISDDVGAALLKAHAEDCKRSGDKSRIKKVEGKKTAAAVVTSASASPKKGAK